MKKIMIRNATEGNEFKIGTITILNEKPRFNGYALKFKPEGKKFNLLSELPNIGIIRSTPHLKKDNKRVYLFIKELKVGNYEFYDYSLVESSGFGHTIVSSKTEFDIPFKVQADSINYIENITYYPEGCNKDNLILISDNFEGDLPLLKEKYPRKNWKTVQNKTLKEGILNDALVEFK